MRDQEKGRRCQGPVGTGEDTQGPGRPEEDRTRCRVRGAQLGGHRRAPPGTGSPGSRRGGRCVESVLTLQLRSGLKLAKGSPAAPFRRG